MKSRIQENMKRIFDFFLAVLAACFLLVPVLVVAALVRLTSKIRLGKKMGKIDEKVWHGVLLEMLA